GSPLVVFGRSPVGIAFSPSPAEPVHLIFLVVTPAEDPSPQVFLLGQLARVAGNAHLRERLRNAASPSEVIEVVSEAGHPPACEAVLVAGDPRVSRST